MKLTLKLGKSSKHLSMLDFPWDFPSSDSPSVRGLNPNPTHGSVEVPVSMATGPWIGSNPQRGEPACETGGFSDEILAINSINTTYVKHPKTMSCICTCGSFFDVSGVLSFRWEVTSGTCRETYHGILWWVSIFLPPQCGHVGLPHI